MLSRISSRFGERASVWRYDTILNTTLSASDWHIGNFSKLAKLLNDATGEFVVSFAQIYRKTRRGLYAARRLARVRDWD